MTFRIGLVGTGWAVRVQAPAFKKAGFEVTGLWARDLEKGKKIAQEVGIPFVTDNVDELIGHKEVDIVAVVTPPFTHLDLAKKTLQHNKHLFLEKPMVLNVAEAKELSNVVSNYLKSNPNHVALVDHELRFLQSMRTMKQYIQEGKIGKVIHVEGRFTTNSRANNKRWYWWFDNTKGGGVLGAIGSHIIDSLQYLTNSKVTAVSGKLDTKIKEREVEGTNPVEMKTVTADDHTTALVEFNGGEFTGYIECSVITQNTKLHRFAVTGTEGTLTIDHGTLKWFHSETEEVVFTEESADVWSVGTANIARALHDFLSGQDKTTLSSIAASIDDGVYIQRVMEAILVSSEKRQWISL